MPGLPIHFTPAAIEFMILFGATAFAILAALGLGFWLLSVERRKALLSQLKPEDEPLMTTGAAGPPRQILLDDPDEAPKRWYESIPGMRSLHNRIKSAGLDWTVPAFLVWTLLGLTIGVLAGYLFPYLVTRGFSMIVIGLAAGAVPWFALEYKRSQRLKEFEEQLPEGLDFIARAIRAGHALSISFEMMATESPDPLRSEFRQVFNEMNLGSSLDSALHGLARRVPLIDVKFFVSAVLLQKETGGNLSEIMSKLSHTIRERFRLKGQVRAMTAHGRMTAGVLTALPVVFVAISTAQTPEYLASMVQDPHGRMLAIAGIVAQILGYIVIKRMVNIKV